MHAMLADGAPQDLVMLPEITAPEDERHARLLERMRARLPLVHRVPWGPSVAVARVQAWPARVDAI